MQVNNSLTSNFQIQINTASNSVNRNSALPDNTSQNKEKTADESKSSSSKNKEDFTPSELELIEELKTRDQEVKDHEMAHVAAGGSYVKRGAKFQYKKGPDGMMYAVGGDVLIDTSAIPGDPQATMRKMDVIKSAALAPASPSGADRAIASSASSVKMKAQEDLIKLELEKSNIESGSKASKSEAANSYINTGTTAPDPGSFVNVSG